MWNLVVSPQQIFRIIIIAAILGIGGLIWYQDSKIKSQTTEITLQKTAIENLNTDISNLKNQIVGVTTLVVTYQQNQTVLQSKQQKLQASVDRFQKIATKKPNLLANKIEQAYNRDHLEISCFSGSEEACNELQKTRNSTSK